MSGSQRVLIDDTDPRIQYAAGQWTQEEKGLTDGWDSSMPYNDTLNRMTSTNASFTLQYSGTRFTVIGTIDASTQPSPSWTCSFDNRPPSEPYEADPGKKSNGLVLCDETFLPGDHTLKLQASLPTAASRLWLDVIMITPNKPLLTGETVSVDDNDPSISYLPSKNFKVAAPATIGTNIPGSSVKFKFNGTSASLYGALEPGLPAGKGRYAVDDQAPTGYDIPSVQGNATMRNQKLVQVSNLSPDKTHTLVVSYDSQQGTSSPLDVDFFYVTLPPDGTVITGNAPEPYQAQKHSAPVGAIVGGVVGGFLALLALIILALVIRRKRSKKTRQSHSTRQYENATPTGLIFTGATYSG